MEKISIPLIKIKFLAKRLFLFLASLKLAVIVIVGLIGLSTWGTIVESNYDAKTAQEVVFRSPLMSFVLFLLVINLLFSMMKKFPWQKKTSTILTGSYRYFSCNFRVLCHSEVGYRWFYGLYDRPKT